MVQIQKSFDSKEPGLYIVPTPIGNLDDMTYRAVSILQSVDMIACEDTRQTKKLLHYFNIEKPLISYHEHNKFEREEKLINLLKDGQTIALVSDAGMPIISDPGFELVRRVREEGVNVTALPGANAALTALVGSGITSGSFTFYGFLPRKKKELKEVFEELGKANHTLIFYESPHRVKHTIEVMNEVYSSDRKVVVARELTKKFEEYVYGSLDEVSLYMKSEDAELRGEFCIVLEGRLEFEDEQNNWWEELSVKEHVDHYVRQGDSPKDAIKKVAKERGQAKNKVYQAYHE
ncbi:16S rRNA (cytidine(1402)-2'-O)-methyltransferase [Piscibacillus salipiscarius]|uniref:Ribosomal RNA small subunit methyltransferase I n=1 Tax=Piscibacillus salipiscarius TaxID=299480 RepID=A0ABW5Q9H2_9BACI